MTDVLKMSRKALTLGVVLTTILWSMMATVLVAPVSASAAGCTSGTLIKGSLAAVYYCGADGKRYVFTNDKNYWTWYPDFSGVMIISDADLASIQIGGNVTYRPGVKMVKIQTDPKVYALSHGGVLRPIASEAVAACLYGATWNKQIDDISDAFFTNYSVGAAINNCSDYDKNAEMSSSQSINQDKGLSTTSVSGSLSVSLASDNPASATVPSGATSVNMLKFNLHNGGASSTTVDSITIHRAGPGATSDIDNVYLYEGATRLTTGRSVNSSTNDANFTGLNLTLAAGQTRTLWVAVDIDANPGTGNVHMMELTHALSGTTEAAGQPLLGNNFTLAAATVGSLTIAKTGSLSNPKLGEQGAKLAEFTIAAGSSEDVTLKRLTIYQAGNLNGSNLTNLTLKQAGLTLSTASGLDSNLHATFDMPAGFLLAKGQTKTFQVYGDVGGTARAGDTIRLYLEEKSDLYGVGSTFGYGVTVDNTGYDNSANNGTDASWTSVDAGQVTIGFSGPSSMNVATNGKDVELFHFTIVTQSNVEVRKLVMHLADNASGAGAAGLLNTSNVANYTDVKVTNVKTGTTWWGPKDVTGTDATAADLAQDLSYNDVWTLQAGQTYEFKVTADIAQNANPGDQITATLNAFGSADLRNLDNNTFMNPATDVVPTGNIQGNPMTIQAPSLAASLSATPVSQSFVKGSAGVDFVGMNVKAGDAANVTVTEVDATGFIDDSATSSFVAGTGSVHGTKVSDDILTCRLMDGTTQVGQSKSPSATDGTMNFTNVNTMVNASMTKSLKINCDISNSAFKDNDPEKIAFHVTVVTAQDPDGNNITTSGLPVNGSNTTAVTINNTGTMSYALAPDDTESEAGLAIAGQSGVVLGKIRLTAANEELKQTKMRITLVTAANYTNVVAMSLYDGSTLVAGPVPVDSSGNADFTGMSFVVPKDGSKTLTVKADLNTISGGGTSGANLKIMTDLTNPAAGTFEYRGTMSSTVATTINTADVTGKDKILRKTKPTVSLASLPTSTLSSGTQVIERFTVTADSAQQVSLKTLGFESSLNNVGGTALSIASAAVREVGQGSDIAATVSTTGTCSTATSATCDTLVTFGSEQSVSAGTSKTYELRVTVGGADASGESISTKMLGDAALVTGELEASGANIQSFSPVVASTAYNFIWSDNSAIPHNDTSGGSVGNDAGASDDWTNGLYVKVLPSDAQTMSRS